MFGLFLNPQQREVKKLQKYVDATNALEDEVHAYSDKKLFEKASELQKIAQEQILSPEKTIRVSREKDKPWTAVAEGKAFIEAIDELIPYSAALVREATLRIAPAFRLRDVQVICSAALAKGKLTEFFTGEGKTFVAIMPLFLYGLFGRGSHLVTVNEYLAKLHGEWAGRILDKLGLTTGVITHDKAYKFVRTENLEKVLNATKGNVSNAEEDTEETEDEDSVAELVKKAQGVDWAKMNTLQGYNLVEVSKKEAYGCDVTYGTNSEFGFDYLRDNMARSIEDVNQRELFYCIVDEADSIMIDESRTPLIISAPADESVDMYKKFAQIAARLDKEDVDIDEKDRSVTLKEDAVEKVQKSAGISNIWEDYQASHHLENALKAQFLFKKDDQYIVQEGQVMIVDEFTGRVLPGRRWSEGLHQAVEAKEHVDIQRRSSTLATVTYQNFFRLYYVLGGMTGTALTEAEEFSKIYNLDVVVIPTHLPVIRKDRTDVIYKTEPAKFKAVVTDIMERHEKGQPVLVGTTSVEKSELLSKMLIHAGVKHEVLNAKHHEREAKIVAKAGEYRSVTISTNMAGRGTDIRLGSGLQYDLAYGNIAYALRRIGVLPEKSGKTEFGYESVTLEAETDVEYEKVELAAKTALAYISSGNVPSDFDEMAIKRRLVPIENLKNKPKIAEDLDISFSNTSKKVTIAIKPESGLWKKVKPSNGGLETKADLGLHVLGTERHESRRIDNQLRGRSGRQGDPGSSQFFVSTQDDLMRIFGGETIERLLNNMGVDDEMPIASGILAKQIEAAQKKVEGYNFDIRKHLVKYDDVMNEQREVFYGRRRKVLSRFDRDMKKVSKHLGKAKKGDDVPEGRYLLRDLTIESVKAHVSNLIAVNTKDKKIVDVGKLWKEFSDILPENLAEKVVEESYKVSYEVWVKQLRKNSDADRVSEKLMQLVDEAYDYKENDVGAEVMRKIERWVALSVMDQHWTEHLDFMSDLRSAIGLRGYGQHDPLNDYKNEAFGLFSRMLANVEDNTAKRIFKVDVAKQPVEMRGVRVAGKPSAEVYQQLAKQLIAQKPKPVISALDRAVSKVAMQSGNRTDADINSKRKVKQKKETRRSTGERSSALKVGRNEPCPCGSGRKYKKCCYPQFG